MKNKLTNYLILILGGCFVISGSSGFVMAQSSEILLNGVKEFGYSVKRTEKKKQDKAKSANPNLNLANENNSSNDDEIIRVDTVMVLNEVLVFDKNGNPAKDLKKEDFIVKEDDELQEITTFFSGDSEAIPRSIVLIIDYSPSQLPFIENSLEAAKILVDKLNPNDRIAIVTDNVELLQGFTIDKNLLKEKLESLKTRVSSGKVGNSKQYSALMATLNELYGEKSLRPIIIFQTDGDELTDLKGEIANFYPTNPEAVNFSYKDILTATERAQATIYTIIPGLCFNEITENEKLERVKTYLEDIERFFSEIRKITFKPKKPQKSLEFARARIELLEKTQSAISIIAKSTGGSAKCLEQIEQAGKIYEGILSEMNQRYIIGYYPKNQARDGRRRNVETEIRGHSDYKILGRKTYILSQ